MTDNLQTVYIRYNQQLIVSMATVKTMQNQGPTSACSKSDGLQVCIEETLGHEFCDLETF